MDLQLSIILPTYNERENIVKILERLDELLRQIPHEFVVVDDNSPDETWAVVQELQARFPNLTLIRRLNRKGLSTAIVEGFLAARGPKLLVTDADLQHDLSRIPELLERSQQADLVIGTRYETEGAMDGWDPRRMRISELGTQLAQRFLAQPVSDPLSGFFLIDRVVFHQLAPTLNSNGFKLLLEILIKHPELSYVEVPCLFQSREHGESKLTPSIVFDFLDTLLKSRLLLTQTNPILEKVAVGSLGLLLNVVLYVLLVQGNLPSVLAGICSISLTLLVNLYLKAKIRRVRFTRPLLHKYLLSRTPAAFSVVYLLSMGVGGSDSLWLESFMAITIGSGWNFFGDYFVREV